MLEMNASTIFKAYDSTNVPHVVLIPRSMSSLEFPVLASRLTAPPPNTA